jgi:hypothetical protein
VGTVTRPPKRPAVSSWPGTPRANGVHADMPSASQSGALDCCAARRVAKRPKFARLLETIIEQGIWERDFPAQEVQAAAACIVGSLFEGLVGPLALESPAASEDRLD